MEETGKVVNLIRYNEHGCFIPRYGNLEKITIVDSKNHKVTVNLLTTCDNRHLFSETLEFTDSNRKLEFNIPFIEIINTELVQFLLINVSSESAKIYATFTPFSCKEDNYDVSDFPDTFVKTYRNQYDDFIIVMTERGDLHRVKPSSFSHSNMFGQY